MRHNQNARRFRGRNNNHGQGGGGHGHGGGGGGSHQRRINPRVQSFDSNGPDVRVRGTAFQINEKYLALAKDAASAGDRVLAESYLQHAEHYQRMINELTEEYNRNQPQGYQQQPYATEEAQPSMQMGGGEGEQPVVEMSDLDQGFLVGPRHGAQPSGQQQTPVTDGLDAGQQPTAEGDASGGQPQNPRRRHFSRQREAETA